MSFVGMAASRRCRNCGQVNQLWVLGEIAMMPWIGVSIAAGAFVVVPRMVGEVGGPDFSVVKAMLDPGFLLFLSVFAGVFHLPMLFGYLRLRRIPCPKCSEREALTAESPGGDA